MLFDKRLHRPAGDGCQTQTRRRHPAKAERRHFCRQKAEWKSDLSNVLQVIVSLSYLSATYFYVKFIDFMFHQSTRPVEPLCFGQSALLTKLVMETHCGGEFDTLCWNGQDGVIGLVPALCCWSPLWPLHHEKADSCNIPITERGTYC